MRGWNQVVYLFVLCWRSVFLTSLGPGTHLSLISMLPKMGFVNMRHRDNSSATLFSDERAGLPSCIDKPEFLQVLFVFNKFVES